MWDQSQNLINRSNTVSLYRIYWHLFTLKMILSKSHIDSRPCCWIHLSSIRVRSAKRNPKVRYRSLRVLEKKNTYIEGNFLRAKKGQNFQVPIDSEISRIPPQHFALCIIFCPYSYLTDCPEIDWNIDGVISSLSCIICHSLYSENVCSRAVYRYLPIFKQATTWGVYQMTLEYCNVR